jgi:hypothetical protein
MTLVQSDRQVAAEIKTPSPECMRYRHRRWLMFAESLPLR